MALISLDYMQFYVPPSQAFEPGLSAQKMPPASSVAASSTTVAVSVGGHEGQNAEARPRDEEAAPTDFEMGSLRAGTTDAGPSDEPTASTESVEHVQDGEGRRGTVVFSGPYFAVLFVQDLGSRSTKSSHRPVATTTLTMASSWPRSCSFLTGRVQLGPLALRV